MRPESSLNKVLRCERIEMLTEARGLINLTTLAGQHEHQDLFNVNVCLHYVCKYINTK